jgi:hypothetical protein
MIRGAGSIKAGGDHIRAFMCNGGIVSGVIARHSRPKGGVASARL